ncbi:hypothetical protein [Streptomyces sp. NPDC001828]|uniref:hypothetical protein n=1 Tax=Streptomyces sp. NPDC001828 TaxID=3364615 RepID=UPI00369C105C
MTGTADPTGRPRLRRIGAALLLLTPLLLVGAVSGQGLGGRAEADAADPTAPSAGRIAYAGTEHRSLGEVSTTTSSAPLFGAGPAHFDQQPSARGDLTVFTSLRDDVRPQLYLRDATGAVRKLTTGRDAAHPRLTPDGTSVVFDSAEPGGPAGGTQRDLWLVRTDGSGLRRLTDSPADEVSPTVSPDGTRIAYASDADPLRGSQVYTRALDGGAAALLSGSEAGQATEPVWNPVDDPAHRDLVAYTFTASGQGNPSLRVTDGKGTDGPLLAGDAANWRTKSASWLPDGEGLLFLSPDRTCGCEGDWDHVYRTRAHTPDAPTLVLSENRAVDSPTWLGPLDGGKVIVARTSAPAVHVATLQDVRQDGSDPRDLGLTILKEDPAADTNTDPSLDPLFNPAAGYDPWDERQNYTPDGRRIVLTRFEDSPDGRIERIWLADADGSHAAPVPLAGRGPKDWDTDPTFSPDGKFLAFTRTSPGGTGGTSGPGRILIADAATGAIVHELTPPAGQSAGGDAQPTWSTDGATIAFTRNAVINGGGGNKHIWTVPVNALDHQRDFSATICPGACDVIDDSPAFSPDGRTLAFNRKDGGGRVNERDGLVVASVTGGDCKVVAPPGLGGNPDACRQPLPDTSEGGPFQPRDAAWCADGKTLVFSARRGVAPNQPEALVALDLTTGNVGWITRTLPGRQKEPSVQQSVDLVVRAPAKLPPLTAGSSTSITVTVLNNGPAASPGTVFTAAPPAGLRLDGLTSPGGTCPAGSLQCDLGVIAPGASVPVTVRVTGVSTGDQHIGWSVNGAVLDPSPTDNAAETVVPVTPVPQPPTKPPTIPPTTSPTPPAPPPPTAGPGVSVAAQPSPGYVGGHVVVTYTVRNGRNALATGLRLRLGLPPDIPRGAPPAGCDASLLCALPDLPQGASAVVRVVLNPRRAERTQVSATLTTTGTDANPNDNAARIPLRILQPRIVAVPPLGKPGFVTSVRGRDFPPGAPVSFTWQPGITAAAAPTFPGPDGTFIGQLLILTKDQTGPRVITAAGPGFSPVTTEFLVVAGSVQPPDEVERR